MTSSTLSSKSVRFSAIAAATAALIATIGVAFQQYPAASTAIAIAASLGTIMTRDYSPRQSRLPRRAGVATAARCEPQRFPLAV